MISLGSRWSLAPTCALLSPPACWPKDRPRQIAFSWRRPDQPGNPSGSNKPSLAAFPLARQPDVFLASRVLAAELARLAGPLPTWRRTILYLDGGPPLFDERLLALPGCCAPIARCDAGGWHVPRDAGVAEIHTDGFDAGAPPVRLIAGAAEHERGVLVFTAFSSVAPVVRFATGLTIRAAGLHSLPLRRPGPAILRRWVA